MIIISFSTLPRCLGAQDFSLRHLRDLSLAGNRLVEVPAEIAQALPALQQLWLHGNQLRRLPDAGTVVKREGGLAG